MMTTSSLMIKALPILKIAPLWWHFAFAVITAWGLQCLLGDKFISYQRGKFQPIRLDGPLSHRAKIGTPTMGGLPILASYFFAALLWSDLSNLYVISVLLATLGYGVIGYVDDCMKLKEKNHRGIRAKTKLFFQLSIGLLIGFFLHYHDAGTAYCDTLLLPWGYNINLGWLYPVFIAVTIAGTSNAVNLTDGLDGLAGRVILPVAFFFTIYSFIRGSEVISVHLGHPYITGVTDLTILCASMIGSIIAFLWYNGKPAQIFMGDVGSLAIGGMLGTVVVINRGEFALCITGSVLVAEALSVMLQVWSFKLRGKRVLLMAPLHHHFEKLGWPETKVVERFTAISIISVIVGLLCL